PYKFFGPHQGVLWGKYELLDRLPPYKVRPAENHPPHKFETGTQSHEGQAGTLGALEHIEWIGRQFGHKHASQFPKMTNSCLHMHCGMAAIKTYEQKLSAHLIEGLQQISEVRIYGITNTQQLDERVPTVSFTVKGYEPSHIAQIMGDKNIFVWDGHNYAIETMSQLGLEKTGGMIRVGPAHYNTIEELDQLLEVLTESVVKH
ncbi:MAG: aminotransferase class V-fold PLP-dependent enzyme, partial [Chloroflexota bacterium]|nr:aminotransferase class V-fold PLP-dependent enzyme [Chloroflexota bacterium]